MLFANYIIVLFIIGYAPIQYSTHLIWCGLLGMHMIINNPFRGQPAITMQPNPSFAFKVLVAIIV